MKDDEKNQTEFKCSECGETFVHELDDLIVMGKVVYCERCGTPFKKDSVNKGVESNRNYQTNAPSLGTSSYNRKDQSAKININIQRDAPRPPQPQRPVQLQRPSQPPKAPQPVNKPTPKKIPQQDIDGLHNAIDTLTNLIRSPLIPIITLIISVIRLAFIAGSTTPLATASDVVARLIVMLMIYVYTLREITPKLIEGDYSSLGIDAIIFGSIGTAAYGMGGLILAVGILVLVHQLILQNNHLIDQIIPEELNYEILGMNVIEVIITKLNQSVHSATAYVIVLGIPTILNETSFFLGAIWFYFIIFIVSLFMLSYIKDIVMPTINNTEAKGMEEGFLIKSLVFAAICLSFVAAGVFLMILVILIFIYREGAKDVEKKLEIRKATGKQFPVPNPENKNRINVADPNKQQQPNTGIITHIVEVEPKELVAADELKKLIATNELKKPVVVEEPKKPLPIEEPKKPVPVEDPSRTQLVGALETKKIESKVPEKADLSFTKDLDIKNNKDLESYLNRVFTVLTKDTRKRILNLDIPDDQKVEVLREFVNLKEEQQEKYLKELENINQKISKDLINRISRMSISESEKKTLINQLEFMSPENQLNFVKYIETEQQH